MALPADHGVHQLVADRVAAAPEHDAVVDEHGVRLTYASLWRRSGALAASLAARGVRPGDRVGVALDRSVDLVVAMLAVARAGAAYVPVDPSGPPARAAMVLSAAGCAVVLSGGLVEEGASFDRPGPFDAETPLYVAYTSGSTGEPKGVVVPHRAVLALVTEPHYCPLGPGDRVAQLANPAFDATTFEVWSTLCAGATIVVLPPVAEIAIGGWGELLPRRRISTMFLTTAVFDLVSRDEPAAFASLDTLMFGGEAVDLAAVRRVLAAGPPRRLVNVYGPTETTTFASYFDCTPASLAGLERVPIGFPLQNTTLCVVDEELSVVPVGQAGELCVGGPGVALGYLGKPAATSQKFLAGPLYRTGDRVRQLPSGAIEFLGRADRQVKLRGFRVELGEVEAAVLATGLVTAAVVEKVGTGFLAGLVAFVVPAPGYSDASVTAVLRERLPSYLVPGRWVVLSRFPLSGTGKIDRARLLADLAERPAVSSIQERLWFAEQAEPGTAAYTVPVLLRWPAVDPGTLSAALNAVAARHETLRTAYRSRDGLPAPVDAERVPFEVLEGEPDVASRVREPLDLARGPLWCTVWRDLVLLRVHHIAADGWSLGILLDDLADAYAGLTLAPPPLRYAEFAAGEHVDPPAELAGYPTELVLQGASGGTSRPAGVPRPGGAFPTAVVDPLWTEVRELARRLRTTPFAVLLAAFEVVVARWSGHDRFLLGTGVANRPRAELQDVVGPFANTVVLRCDVRPDASFASMCGLAGREVLVALARPSVRLDRLVAAAGGRAPVVSVMFTYASAPPSRTEAPWSAVTYPPTGAAKFDLMLHLSNDAAGLAGVVEYDNDRYDRAFAAALAGGFHAVLAAAVADPDRPVSALPLTARPPNEPPPGALVADRVDLTSRVLARLAANRREHTP